MTKPFLEWKETKLIITLFVVYFLFMHWVGWNEESRISLAKSISREGELHIDTYANFTGDRSFYKGHYYSEKAPGTSFLAVPIVSLSDLISRFLIMNDKPEPILIQEKVFRSIISFYDNLPFQESLIQILSITILSVIPGTLLGLVIYRTTLLFVENDFYCLLTAFFFGLGTLIMPYSSVMMGEILAAFLGFTGIYIIIKNRELYGKMEKSESSYISLIAAGTLLGFSFVISYMMFLVIVPTILLQFRYVKLKKTPLFLLGIAIGMAPILFYNSSIYESPFHFTFEDIDPEISPCHAEMELDCQTVSNLDQDYWLYETITVLPGVAKGLFNPYRGLFFYYPFLIVSVLGLYKLYKKDGKIAFYVLTIFLLFSLFTNYYPSWEGGSSFSMRYFVSLMPFLSIPFVVAFDDVKEKTVLIFLILSLVLISCLINLLSTSAGWEGPIRLLKDSGNEVILEWSTMKLNISETEMKNKNPLYGHYIPMLFKNGPRSRIFESLLSGKLDGIDIRDFKPMPIREIKLFTLIPFGIFTIQVPFLIVPMVLITLLIIWMPEIVGSDEKRRSITIVLIGILVISIPTFFIRPVDLYYDNQWLPVHVNGTYVSEDRWMSDKASIYVYSPEESESNLVLRLGSFYRPRRIRVSIDEQTSEHFVSSFYDTIPISGITLKRGINEVELMSLSTCDIPVTILNDSEDYRCLSFISHGVVSVSDIPNYEPIFTDGWYKPDVRFTWSNGDSTISIFSAQRSEAKIRLKATSYHEARRVKMSINNILVDTIRVDPFETEVLTNTMHLREGMNTLTLEPDLPCRVPYVVEGANDTRCLSIAIDEIEVVSPFELAYSLNLEENVNVILYGHNWYKAETGGRWMSDNSSMFLFSEEDKRIDLGMTIYSYKDERELQIYVNKRLVDTVTVPSRSDEIVIEGLEIEKDENLLEFKTSLGCKIPSNIEDSKDDRCLSLKLLKLEIIE